MRAILILLLLSPYLLIAQLPSGNQLSRTSPTANVTSEIDALVKTSEQDILDFAKSQVNQVFDELVISALGSQLNITPTGEVKNLKNLLQEGYTTKQWIEYQKLKLNYEKDTAHTRLSPRFIKFYEILQLPTLANSLDAQGDRVTMLVLHPTFSAKERQLVAARVAELRQTADLLDDVRTVCNLKGEVWMSEYERMQIWKLCRADLLRRQTDLQNLQLAMVETKSYRTKEMAKNSLIKGMYSSNSGLNRTAPTR